MEQAANTDEQARIERAKRLRAHIERLKSGAPSTEPPRSPSIKEQLEERRRKLRDKGE
jgi:hypothetical protein